MFLDYTPPLRVEFSTDLEIGHVCNREKSAKTVEQIENYEQHLNVHIFGLYILQLNIWTYLKQITAEKGWRGGATTPSAATRHIFDKTNMSIGHGIDFRTRGMAGWCWMCGETNGVLQ